jgi:hypothetical protein
MPRIVVIGGPRTGKTTYATKLARELGVHLASTGKRTDAENGLVSTDNYIKRGTFEQVPDLIIKDLRKRESFVLEGTQAARTLRRWLRDNPDEPKLDKVLVFGKPWVKRTPGQEAMAKGVKTVLRDMAPLLAKAGVKVEHMTPEPMSEEDWREYRSEKLAEAATEEAGPAEPEAPDEVISEINTAD